MLYQPAYFYFRTLSPYFVSFCLLCAKSQNCSNYPTCSQQFYLYLSSEQKQIKIITLILHHFKTRGLIKYIICPFLWFITKFNISSNYSQDIQQLTTYLMSQANAQDLKAIFKQVDTNNDGYISKSDLEASPYAQSIFDNDYNALIAFNKLDDKMNQEDFLLLANGYRLKLHQLAVAKFQIAKTIRKYYSVTAPGEAGPSLKQSFLKFTAHNDKPNEKQQKLGVQFGIDKVQQGAKIKQLAQVLGHPPHQVFFLLKFKTNSKGGQIAQKLNAVLNELLELFKGLAPQAEQYINIIRIHVKYGNGYTYLVVEIDNPFIDSIINFFNEVVEAISPVCQVKFRSYISSNVNNILKSEFSYEATNGEILAEFDIDNVTLHKIKKIIGDNVNQNENPSPVPLIFSLLFEELKLSVQFNNLGQALQSAFMLDGNFPTPSTFLGPIKEMGLKETLGQFSGEAEGFLDLIKENCEAQGEISINFHDFYLKIQYDLSIESAFDLL